MNIIDSTHGELIALAAPDSESATVIHHAAQSKLDYCKLSLLFFVFFKKQEEAKTHLENIEENHREKLYTLAYSRCQTHLNSLVKDAPLCKTQQEATEKAACIFDQLLTRETLVLLKDPNSIFCANNVFTRTKEAFVKEMLQQALDQYKVICLIERHAWLQKQRDDEKNKYSAYQLRTKIERFDAEISAIDKLLIMDLNIEPISILATVLPNCATWQAIAHEIDTLTCPTKSRIMVNFNSDRPCDTHIKTYLLNAYETASLLADTLILEKQSKVLNIPQDEPLLSLRKIMADYQNHLDELKTREKNAYQLRNVSSIKKREAAIQELTNCIHQANTLDPSLKETIINHINIIKSCEPRWREHTLIQRILDVLSFGACYFVRWCRFHTPTPTKNLYALQTTLKNRPIIPPPLECLLTS